MGFAGVAASPAPALCANAGCRGAEGSTGPWGRGGASRRWQPDQAPEEGRLSDRELCRPGQDAEATQGIGVATAGAGDKQADEAKHGSFWRLELKGSQDCMGNQDSDSTKPCDVLSGGLWHRHLRHIPRGSQVAAVPRVAQISENRLQCALQPDFPLGLRGTTQGQASAGSLTGGHPRMDRSLLWGCTMCSGMLPSISGSQHWTLTGVPLCCPDTVCLTENLWSPESSPARSTVAFMWKAQEVLVALALMVP